MSHSPLRAAALACAVLLAFGPAIAASKKSAKTTKALPTKVTFIDAPSSEDAAARKARLKIECKGRPNAGACLGLTR